MTDGNDIAIALRSAYLALHRQSEARFARQGATADQFVLLAALAQGVALTQRELARRISSDPSTVRAMLVLLERRRLVKRETHPTDARARTVSLTKAGLRMFRKLWAAGEPVRVRMLDSLRCDDVEELVGMLNRITEGLTAKDGRTGESTSLHSQEDDP